MKANGTIGGPANITGIHYQILRSLLQATRVLRFRPNSTSSAALSECQLILEPRDGGDLQVKKLDGLVVEQMKTMSSGTWSLSVVIHEVLPDLFRAFRDDSKWTRIARARFVTNARQGNWTEFPNLLSLGHIEYGEAPLQLNDDIPLKEINSSLQGKLEKREYSSTARGLFLYIAEILKGEDPAADHLQRVELLLREFEFVHITEDELKTEVRNGLLPRILKREDLPDRILGLIGDLLNRSRNSESLDPQKLMAEHGLAEDLSSREVLERSQRKLKQKLALKGYDRDLDVRGTRPLKRVGDSRLDTEDPTGVEAITEPLCVVGESGIGKSWLLDALALNRSEKGRIVVKCDAAGNYEASMDRASAYFCNDVWDRDGVIPITRAARRIREIAPSASVGWVELMIDGVQSQELAARLLARDWSSQGIQLSIALTSDASDLPEAIRHNSRVVRVEQFTTAELSEYLARRLPGRHLRVPYAREGSGSLIYRPLFAKLYGDIASRGDISVPATQYELLDRYSHRFHREMPMLISRLAALAAETPNGRSYPWSQRTLVAAGLNRDDVLGFVRAGLLRREADRRTFSVVHSRVLAWLIAERWNEEVRDSNRSVENIAEQAKSMLGHDRETCWGRLWLGSAIGGLLWLLMEPSKDQLTSEALALVKSIGQIRWAELSVIGARAVPILSEVVRSKQNRIHGPVEALVEIGTQEVRQLAVELLREDDRDLQLVGARIARSIPVPEALDYLWDLRVEMEHDEQPHWVIISEVVAKALTTSAREADDWIESMLLSTNPEVEPSESLVYLLPRMPEGKGIWLRTRSRILSIIPESKARCIALCMETFNDKSNLEWLGRRVNRTEDNLGAAARRALTALAPDRPIDALEGDSFRLALSRYWWLLPQINLDLERAQRFLLSELESVEAPWPLTCTLLAGLENYLAPRALDRLLDLLLPLIYQDLESEDSDNRGAWRPLRFLSRICRPELLARIESRAGSELEDSLIAWLTRYGPNNTGCHDWQLADAVSVLLKINGPGIGQVADSWLERAELSWSFVDALELAMARSTNETAGLVRDAALREETEGIDDPITQLAATGTLLATGEIEFGIESLRKWAHKISWDVADLLGSRSVPSGALDPVRQVATESSSPPPNDFFLLAALGESEDLDLVYEYMESIPKGSESARMALTGLYVGNRRRPEDLQLFLDHLGYEETEYICILGLLGIGSKSAIAALMDLLPRPGGLNTRGTNAALVAINLLEMNLGVASEVASLLWSSLDKHEIAFFLNGSVGPLLSLGRPEISQWIEDVAFSVSGQRPEYQTDFIRALAEHDPEVAFRAAQRLLESGRSEEPATPGLLLLSDPHRAPGVLRESLASESSCYFLASTGEALDHYGAPHRAIEWLRDADPRIREAACVVAEPMCWTAELDEALRECSRDEDRDVRTAANGSLNKLWISRQVARLVDELLEEPSWSRKWCLLETVLALGHPGLLYGPPWVQQLFKHLDFPFQMRMKKRLKKRRQEAKKEYERRDRRS